LRGPVVGTIGREVLPWGIPASLALHALLAATLALMPLPKRPKRLEEERVSVDILTPQQFEATIHPMPAPVVQAPEPQPPPKPAEPPRPAAQPSMIHATARRALSGVFYSKYLCRLAVRTHATALCRETKNPIKAHGRRGSP
jgi:hypothetical protein